MQDEWFVRRGNTERGPLTLSELKRLVAKGTVAATDLVRNSDQSEWNEVGSVEGLFPPASTASSVPPPLPSTATLRSPPSSSQPKSSKASEKVKAGLADLVSTAKQAKDLASAHARKTQISQMILPKAYLTLGKDVFLNERFQDEFGDLFQRITATNDELAKVAASTKERPQATDLKGKLQSGAAQLMAKGQAAKLTLQGDSLLKQLGKQVFESHGTSAGPSDLVTPIASANEEITRLEAQIGQLSSGDKGPLWQRLPLAVLLTVICWPVGMILVWLNPKLSRKSQVAWTGVSIAAFAVLYVVTPKQPDAETGDNTAITNNDTGDTTNRQQGTRSTHTSSKASSLSVKGRKLNVRIATAGGNRINGYGCSEGRTIKWSRIIPHNAAYLKKRR